MSPAVRPEALHGVFVTALEGGIGYWSTCTRYRWSRVAADGERVDDLDGFHAVIEEDEAGEVHRIDAEVIRRGLAYFAQTGDGYPHVREAACALLAGDEDADYDAEVADCIVQAGLFGEVVYG